MADSKLPHDDDSSLALGSDAVFDIVCQPCGGAGEMKEAEGYCASCREHMCTTCLDCHTKMSLTKNHVIVDKANMPRAQGPSSVSVDVCTQQCKTHKNEVIKYYCSRHKTLGCGVCMALNHGTCRGKLHIPDEARQLDASKEFKDFQAKMETLVRTSHIIIKSSEYCMNRVDGCLFETVYEIETFRQEMNDALDMLKVKLDEQAYQTASQIRVRMTAVAGEASKVQAELQRISSVMNTLQSRKQHCQMFIEMKTSEARLAYFQQQLDRVGTSHFTRFRYKPCQELRRLVRRNLALGELHVTNPKDLRATHVCDIHVQSRRDDHTCRINGAVILSEKKLVISDENNGTMKLIDTERDRILSEYSPEQPQTDVTAVSNIEVAITLPTVKKILFVRADNTLRLDKELRVNKRCTSIASLREENFVVSFTGELPSVGLLSQRTGKLLQTFSTSSRGEQLFSCPPCLTVNPVTRAIHASDWSCNRVVMLDTDGQVLAKYKDDDLRSPNCMAVDNMGSVYVCGVATNNVHLLTPGCEKVKVLLTRRDGIKEPSCLRYCLGTGRLYVANNNSNIIKVFELL